MKLVRFVVDEGDHAVASGRSSELGEGRLGVLDAETQRVADLSGSFGSDLVDLVGTWDLEVVRDAASRASRYPLDTVRLLAPIQPRRDVIAVGRNYRDHAEEFSASGFDASEVTTVPDAPILFTKATTAVIGPDAPIVLANDPTSTTDYEGELGVVIGRGGRNITAAEALEHVFGWTIVNDVTARALQQRHVQWFLGKSPDTFCPLGPCITTIDELPDIAAASVSTRVNGEVRQHMAVADLIFDVPTLIETLSAVMTLEPGDVIATGTGKGVGIGATPPVFLAAGDVVEVSIDGIGTLRNPVV